MSTSFLDKISALWNISSMLFGLSKPHLPVQVCSFDLSAKATVTKVNNKVLLGKVSSAFEAGSKLSNAEKAAVISPGPKGDPGGKSYGAYQFASKTKTFQKFLEDPNNPYSKELLDARKISEEAFDKKWKEIAERDGDAFFNAQHNFILSANFIPVLKMAKAKGLDTTQLWIQEALFSASVQHSPKGNGEIIDNFLQDPNYPSTMTEEEKVDMYYHHRNSYALKWLKKHKKELEDKKNKCEQDLNRLMIKRAELISQNEKVSKIDESISEAKSCIGNFEKGIKSSENVIKGVSDRLLNKEPKMIMELLPKQKLL